MCYASLTQKRQLNRSAPKSILNHIYIYWPGHSNINLGETACQRLLPPSMRSTLWSKWEAKSSHKCVPSPTFTKPSCSLSQFPGSFLKCVCTQMLAMSAPISKFGSWILLCLLHEVCSKHDHCLGRLKKTVFMWQCYSRERLLDYLPKVIPKTILEGSHNPQKWLFKDRKGCSRKDY